MIPEQEEFLLSQYVDGTLSDDQRRIVDDLLLASPQAQGLVRDYRLIDACLMQSKAGPAVNWDRLAHSISSNIARDDARTSPVIVGRIGRGMPRLRIAAAILVAGTAWLTIRHRSGRAVSVPIPAQTSVVTGPESEVATGPAVVDVTIGPSPLAVRTANAQLGKGPVLNPPSKVVLSGLTPAVKPDSHLH